MQFDQPHTTPSDRPVAGRSPYTHDRTPYPDPPPAPEPERRPQLTLVRGEHRSYGGRTDARLAVVMAALASAAAGVIHAAASEAHWSEWPLSGVFFLAMAFFQLAWAAVIVPFWNTYLALAGIAANLGFLGLWAFSRTQGVPIGPHANVPEAIGAADALTTALEVALIVGLLWSLLPRERHGVLSAVGYRSAVVLAALVFGTTLIPGISGALTHGHGDEGHGHGAEEEGDGHEHDHGTETEMDGMTDEATESTESAAESPPAEEEEDHTHAPGEEHD